MRVAGFGGFVLAGGRSSRMGQDKALLELDGMTLVAWAVKSLRTVCEDVAISGGAAGVAAYGRVIGDGQPGRGPLGGIVAALEQSGTEWNLFLAVDVPFVPELVWQGLMERAEAGGAVAVMARCEGQVQPLCAAYARAALPVMRAELEAGRWKVTAAAAAAGQVEYVDFQEAAWFRNVNTPEDFQGAVVHLRRKSSSD